MPNNSHSIEMQPILDLVTIEAEIHEAEDLSERICSDPDDDKFLACMMASGNKIIVRGAKPLVKVSGFHGIEILKPHEFIKRYL